MQNVSKVRLGDLLLDAGLITQDNLNKALELQKNTRKRLGQVLIEEKFIGEEDLVQVLEFQLGIPHMKLSDHEIDENIARMVPVEIAKKHILIPVGMEGNSLRVAMADPLNIYAMDDVQIATGKAVIPIIATQSSIKQVISKLFDEQKHEEALETLHEINKLFVQKEEERETAADVDLSNINDAPAVKLVNTIIQQAIIKKVSDIHIEPFEDRVRVRFRKDGMLYEFMRIEKSSLQPVVTRIKIMGQMDIAERRIPQDGRVEMKLESKAVDLRISVLPTVYGEKIVIRILDRTLSVGSIEQLGFSPSNLQRFNSIIKAPHGIILVTGPTGSGKSTTLYAVLKKLNSIYQNIITVEDPVEYRLDGVNQVQVNAKSGLTFAAGLRSILRQDPDVVMIGEIRDNETAQIAIKAAITGHLVLSTMHTNDTSSTVSRLVDMGIEPYLVSSAVVGVVAQRLVRRICPHCKVSYSPSVDEQRYLHISADTLLHKGEGCPECSNTGYKGRMPIHEVLTMSHKIRALVDRRASIDEIKHVATEQHMDTLSESCRTLVLKGSTTIEEMYRVAYSVDEGDQ